MSEPTDPQTQQPTSPPDPELVRRRQEVQLEVWSAQHRATAEMQNERLRAEIEMQRAQTAAELAAAIDSGLIQQLAMARAIAMSDIAPAGFAAERKPTGEPRDGAVEVAAANIVLVQEMGKMVGFTGMQALWHMQVIKKNVSLKPASARGLMRAKRIRIRDEWTYSETGFPVKCTTSAIRPEDEEAGRDWDVAEYTIEDAAQFGLCSIQRNDAGVITGVLARSRQGEPQNWEKITKDMLMWRATSRLTRAYYSDITGGMYLETDFEDEAAGGVPGPAPEPPKAVTDMLRQVAADRTDRNGSAYDPSTDLTLFSEDDPWWKHADAKVGRRNRKQMAADRLHEAMQSGDTRVPAPGAFDNLTTNLTGQDADAVTDILPPSVEEEAYREVKANMAATAEPLPLDLAADVGPPVEPPPLFADADDTTVLDPPADWQPSPRNRPETREDLLARLDVLLEALGRPREEALARFYVLWAPRREDQWTDDEIRRVIDALNQ